MNNPTKVKMAVIGVGTMGSCHARDICLLGNARLEAVCDIIPERAQQYGEMLGVKAFTDYREMLGQAEVEAVVIATPHYFHTPISIDCFDRGIHVMTEKPIAVHVNDARKMIAAYEKALSRYPGLKFGIMFQQRTHTFWRKIKEMIDQGELGQLVRATWIITDWFRTQYYYDHGDWRATWKGEGGGVLLNQCPHNLDLYQWFFGMPKRIAGYASIGKYHHIEVEDEVTGYFEHENGMVGHFITTTAESPGTNRLEIAGEKGKLVFEDGRLVFYRNLSSMFDFIKEHQDAWDKVDCQLEEINFEEANQPGHLIVLEAFANAILNNAPLIAQGVEGINSLTIGNGIMLSHFLGRPVDLPIDADAYEARLQELIRNSSFQKEVKDGAMGDLNKSFGIF